MTSWKFKYKEKEYEVNYSIYNLTDGIKNYTIHELQYKDRIFRKKSLEKVVGELVKLLDGKK